MILLTKYSTRFHTHAHLTNQKEEKINEIKRIFFFCFSKIETK